MNTKSLIKDKSLQLFNELGLINVSLRDVAKALNKSYGNITYHYKSKGHLLLTLFEDMNEELMALKYAYTAEMDLMEYFLKLPEFNYDITLKYLFFSQDLVEIKRNYPSLNTKAQRVINVRKSEWLLFLVNLREEGYLKKELKNEDLEYIIFLSTSVRTFYFQSLNKKQYNKSTYSICVNNLLKPYLSKSGLKIYLREIDQSTI